MSYPESGSFETAGPCPATHPVRTSQLFYEVLFDTSKFNNKNDWPEDGSQPFVWSFGDGYVYLLSPFPLLKFEVLGREEKKRKKRERREK